MATTELQQMIDVVAKDKGIDPSIVIGAIEDAYLAGLASQRETASSKRVAVA